MVVMFIHDTACVVRAACEKGCASYGFGNHIAICSHLHRNVMIKCATYFDKVYYLPINVLT